MVSLLPRWWVALFALYAGSGAGWWLGQAAGAPLIGAAVGSGLAVTAWVALEGLRAARLMRWLLTAADRPAPRSSGLWGELAYRTERALRSRDRQIELERQRLAQFLSGIEASPNGVLLLDADDRVHWCNWVASDHFGLNAQRDLGQAVTNLVRAPEFVAYLKSGLWDEPIRLPIGLNQHGATDSLSVLVRAYGQGQKLVLSQDISELLRNDLMRRDFVANVSHEIRTPLTVLSGFLETLDSLALSDAERRHMQALMRQQTERMQVLVADLLTLAQLEGSARPTADQWVSVNAWVAQTVADAQRLSNDQHRFHVTGVDSAALAGSEAELRSALGNLLTNAVRYTPAGGRIDVSWRVDADGAGELAVRDTGIGIAREHLPRLTERFYRVDGSRSRATGGTGLGLAIVKHVMQRHGGALDIASAPGQGSCFTLRFPAGRVRREASPALGR